MSLVSNSLPSRPHIHELDSLRGLAAMAVLLSHTADAFDWTIDTSWIQWPLINLLFDGDAAVTLFFVLSGFVLARPFVKTLTNTPRLLAAKDFYLRRVTRVWLPWLFFFVVSLLVKVTLFSEPGTIPVISKWLHEFWHAEVTLHDILLQCLFALDSLENAHLRLLPQDWSLGVEMKASILMPLFVLLVNRSTWLLLLSGLAILIMLPTGQNYFSFVIGVMLARHFDWLQIQAARLSRHQLWLASAICLALYENHLLLGHYLYLPLPIWKLIWTAASLGSALLIVLSLRSSHLGNWLRKPIILHLGKISYSVYLVQMVVLVWLVPVLVHELNQIGLTMPLPEFFVIFALSITLTVGLASLSFRWIEVPCIALGQRLTRQLETPRTSLPSIHR